MAHLIDYLAYRARYDGAAVALQGLDRRMSFAQLERRVAQVGARLRHAGVRPGQRVLTSIADKYVDWIFTLAALHEGAVTCSVARAQIAGFPVRHDWLVANRKGVVDGVPAIVVDAQWLADARKEDAPWSPRSRPTGAPIRITLTSGTTGRPKAIGLSEAGSRDRIHGQLVHFGNLPTLNTMGLASMGGFNGAANCLMTGQPIYCANGMAEAAELLARHPIEGLYGSPTQLGAIASELDRSGRRPAALRVASFTGAQASTAVADRVRASMCDRVVGFYGATEVGRVCMAEQIPGGDPAVLGHPFPGCAVEVVDEEGSPLPAGREGEIRIRTPYMADGYLEDPGAQAFRGGWFHPGDRGTLAPGGLLTMSGRTDERVNLGGVKIDPVRVDEAALAQPGVDDAAAFGFEARRGAQGLGLALVCDPALDTEALRTAIAVRLGRESAPSRVFRVDEIPRNAMGKPLRAALGERFSAPAGRR